MQFQADVNNLIITLQNIINKTQMKLLESSFIETVDTYGIVLEAVNKSIEHVINILMIIGKFDNIQTAIDDIINNFIEYLNYLNIIYVASLDNHIDKLILNLTVALDIVIIIAYRNNCILTSEQQNKINISSNKNASNIFENVDEKTSVTQLIKIFNEKSY
jgi:hypothetical protein